MLKKIRFLFHIVMASTLVLNPLALAESLDSKDRQLLQTFAIRQMLFDYSQLKSVPEFVDFAFRSLNAKKEVLPLLSGLKVLPKIEMKESTLFYSDGTSSIEIDISRSHEGRFVINGLPFTVDQKMPVKMQIDILKRKMEESERKKHSLFSLLIPQAQANRASIAKKVKGFAAKGRTKDELAAQAAAEKAASAKNKDPWVKKVAGFAFLTALFNKTIDQVQGAAIDGLGYAFCWTKDFTGGKLKTEPTNEEVQAQVLCKGYIKEKKVSLEKDRKDREAKEKEKKEKSPEISAVQNVENLQKDGVQGLKFNTVWEACPHESRSGDYRSTLMIITEMPGSSDPKVDVVRIKALIDSDKMKQIEVIENGIEGRGTILATYKLDDSVLSKIVVPNLDAQAKLTAPTIEISATENLSIDAGLEGVQKFHKEIYKKLALSYGACANKKKEAEGKKAASAANVTSQVPSAPVKNTQPAGGAK